LYETAALSYALEHHPSLHSLTMSAVYDTKVDLHLAADSLVHHPSLKKLQCGLDVFDNAFLTEGVFWLVHAQYVTVKWSVRSRGLSLD
jgi:hypothetical protein